MAGIYDTHTHLNDTIYMEIDATLQEMVRDALLAGVSDMNIVGYDVKSSKVALRQANEYPNVHAIIGIHPNEVHLYNDAALDQLEEMLNLDAVVAIGEIGLDYTRTLEHAIVQQDMFRKQIQIALKNNLPIVLHIKDVESSEQAYLDAMDILKEMKVKNAVVHSYEGSLNSAKALLKMGYFLSFSGIVSYKEREDLLEVVRQTPLNKMMLETDAPYAAPLPFKGKVNYPKNALLVARKLAEIKNIDQEDIVSATRVTAQKFFNV